MTQGIKQILKVKGAWVSVPVSINEDALQNISQASPTPHCGARPQQFLPSKQLKHHKPGQKLELPTKRMQGQHTTTVLARRLVLVVIKSTNLTPQYSTIIFLAISSSASRCHTISQPLVSSLKSLPRHLLFPSAT